MGENELDTQQQGGTPPDIPSGEGGTPPDMPSDEGGTPPDLPSGEGGTPSDMSSGGNSSSSITWSGATEITSGGSYDNQTYSSTTFGQNALLISTSENVTLNNPTVTKSGGSTTSDNDSFYGVNTAVLVKGGTTTTINGGTVTTEAAGANGVFSYGGNGGQNGAAGDGTTVVISNTTINTTGDGSGGIMTTGGGVTKASNLTITTTGRSSAAIRSDRGGGTVSVSGGSYTSSGVGSPAIYSTADITVENATLTSNKSEGVCIEGQNSVALNNCTLTANNTATNGNAQFLDAVILYQSMSGDAASGTSTFSMTGGVLNNKSGHLFHVTNTNAVINLDNVTINDSGDGVLLSVCDDGWSGASNIATLNATGQNLTGDILVGNDSTLTLNISDSSTFTGNISGNITNNAGTSISTSVGTVNVSLDSSSKWYLDGDTYITSFSGTAANVITGGHTLYVNNSPLSGTTETEDTTPASVTTALNIANSVNNTLINGTELNDSITNSGTNVTILAQSGNDYIVNNVDSSVTTASLGNLIELGDGDDTVYNYHSYHPTLLGGNGNDSIVVSSGHYTFANGGAGNDSIIGRTPNTVSNGWAMGGYATILGGEGNDYINVGYSNNATIDGGDGNDTIYASGNVATINGGAGSNFVSILPASLDAENRCTYVVLNGNTTVEGFKAGFGNGTDTVYITGESPAVDFKSGGLTLYDGNDTLTFSDIKHTAKLNLYYEASLKAVSEVFIADNEWYSVTGGDLSVRDDSELWFVGATAKMNHGVDFSGISDALNISLNTDYEADVENFRINNIHSIKGGAGLTTITGSDKSDTIIAGKGRTTIDGAGGNDIISLGSAQALVEFTSGDGSDSIYGFNANSTLSIAGSSYSSAKSGSNLILTVGNDKITLFSAASLVDAHIVGTLAGGGSSSSSTSGGSSSSSTSGGSSTSTTSGGSSSSSTSGGSSSTSTTSGGSSTSTTSGGSSTSTTSGGSSTSTTGGGSSTSTTSGGSSTSTTSGGSSTSTTSGGSSTSTTGGGSSTSTTSGGSSTSTTSGGSSTSTTSGGSSTSTASGGSSTSTASGGSSTSTTSSVSSSSIASGGSSTTSGSSITSTASETVTSNETAVVDYIYAGGDEVISNYTSGQKIALGTYPTGGNFVDGNFVLSSASGNLIVQNAMDKVIDMVDSEGNAFAKAYAATNPGIIDGRGIAGYEIIAGSDAGADLIFAGDGGSQLWGGAGIASDTLIGGGGTDIFVGGKYQGADVFGNASAYDVVYLNDTTLSDIVATAEQNGVITVAFNTGNVIAVYSSQTLSSAFVLADGSAWRFNHVNKSWQSA